MLGSNENVGEAARAWAARMKLLACVGGAARRGDDGRPDVVITGDGTAVPGVRRVEKGNFYPFS